MTMVISMRFLIFLSGLAMALIGVAPAGATEIGPYGAFSNPGRHVSSYRIDCEPGAYMVGIVGQTGAWVDRLRIACSQWDGRTGQLGRFHVVDGRTGSSTGGASNWAYCPGGTVINRYEVQSLEETGDVAAIDNLRFHCVSTSPPHDDVDTTDLLTEDSSFTASVRPPACPQNEFVTGIFGEADMYVRTVGIICSAAPQLPPIATPQTAQDMTNAANAGHPGGLRPGSRARNNGPYATPDQTMPAVPPADLPERGPTHPTQTAQGLRYAYPHIRNSDGAFGLLDWCREWGANCGAAAADAFCANQRTGNPKAVDFAQFTDAGRFRETVIFSTRATCTDATCDAFTFVTCGR
jgi:hypothetical protein